MGIKNNGIPGPIHPSWFPHLQPLFNDSKIALIRDNILQNCDFYPAPENIFRVFATPLYDIKVVILGQDPYPNGEAIGLAFAVNEKKPMPASLRVIAKEIESEGLKSGFYDSDIPHWKTLESWTEQGVFLLNTALTVERKKAGSHMGYWQWFTKEVIKIISLETAPVWMLWGAKAQSFRDYIDHSVHIKDETDAEMIGANNPVLMAPHPAAEMYNGGTGKTFSGCNHFNLCNEILQRRKQKTINW